MRRMTPTELAERYTAAWNEPDPDRRRAAVRDLWTEDAVILLQPPQEVVAAAGDLAVGATFRVRGHAEIERRVTRAYDLFIAPGENVFRARGDAQKLDDVVKWGWEMVPVGGDEVLGSGVEIAIVDGDGRITAGYQFIDP
jgi:hypothetical protein